MTQALSNVAKNISKSGTPKAYSPMVFAVTGTGRVAQGILDVLEQLPHIKVKPDDLKNLKNIVGVDQKKIIISQFTAEHLVKHKDGRAFNKADYYANSNNYVTKFAEEYLEHIHWLFNGVYWEAKYPRIISINEIKEAVASGKSKLLGVCDISADYMGSVEFTSRFTSIEQPFLLYDPINEEFKENMNDANEHSILFHSVDHLPAEMPKEASNHFGEKLMPFVKAVVESNFNKPFSEQTDLPTEIKNAVLCAHGELTPKYSYITNLRAIKEKTKQHHQDYMKQVEDEGRKTSSMKRGSRFATILFSGHLFDTKFINSVIELLTQLNIEFRVVDWQVGNKALNTSQVTM